MTASYTTHLDQTERRIIDAIIKEALAEGMTISVYDGDEWAVRKSTDYKQITAEIAATDETTLRIRSSDGKKIGDILLIHGNGEEVISDHSDNLITGRLANIGQAAA